MAVRWSQDSASPDAPAKPRSAFRRILREFGDVREAGFGVVRGLVAVALIVVVLLFALRYAKNETAVDLSVKAPTFVAVPVVARPPPQPPVPPLSPVVATAWPAGGQDWYLRPVTDTRQAFTPAARGAQALCAALAATGFPEAAWAESVLFKGEWECASPSRDGGGAFLVVRGRDSDAATSVMVKLNDASDTAQAPFRALVEDVLARFDFAAGIEPDPEIAARLADWQAGTFRHGVQTLRIVKQHGWSAPNAVHVSVLRQLPPVMEGTCGPDCFPLKPATTPSAEAAKGG